MRKIILVSMIVLLVGCFTDEDENMICDDDSGESKIVQVVVDGVYTPVQSGYTLDLVPCHANGSCGGSIVVKVSGDTEDIRAYGSNFDIAPIDLPKEGNFQFIIDYMFSSLGTYTGSIEIDSFILNLTGEKY